MKTKLLVGAALFATMGLSACGNQFSSGLKNSVQANQDAKTLTEWEASESNPEYMFADWSRQFMTDSTKRESIKKELCAELQALDGQSLSIFDEQIRKKDNSALLADCKDALIKQLEDYYAQERSKLRIQVNALSEKASGNNFQFQPIIEKRDMTNGYFAVSADVGPKEIVLSFDDGPSAAYTPSILRSLKEVGAKVHFFEMGKNVRANPNVTKMVAADGHMIGSHSITHRCLGTSKACAHANGRNLTYEEALAEVVGGHQAVYDVLGWVDPMFRFPYGESSPQLKQFLATNSVGEFFWSLDSEDWKAQSNDHLLTNALAMIDAKGKGMILFHDIQRKTSEILPQFLEELHSRGYSLVVIQPTDANARYNSKIVTKHVP